MAITVYIEGWQFRSVAMDNGRPGRVAAMLTIMNHGWPMQPRRVAGIGMGIWVVLTMTIPASAVDIRFRIVMPPNMPVTSSHQWLETLKSLDPQSVQITNGKGTETPNVERMASGLFVVQGVITRQNELKLPGGTFSLHDKAQLVRWSNTLGERGEDRSDSGESESQLDDARLEVLRKHFAAPVAHSTKGKPAREVASQLCLALNDKVSIPFRNSLIDAALLIEEELQGVATGTALAAVLRPSGLVLHAELNGKGDIVVAIASSKEQQDAWPIGWPYKDNPQRVAPKLLERLEADIEPMPVGEVVEALQARLQLPVLWDHNGMARNDIDPKFDEVSHPPATAQYLQVLRRVLYKANLKYELRLDDGGKPFLWISPVAQSFNGKP